MAGEFKGLTIKFRGDATELTKALSTINSEMRKTTRQATEVERILKMKGASGNVQMFAQKVQLAKDRCREWQDRVDALKEAQGELGERTDENAAQYDHIAGELERAQAKLQGYTQQLHEAEAAYDIHSTKLGRLGLALGEAAPAFQQAGDAMQKVGGKLTAAVTLPLVAMSTASVSSAIAVDDALTGVRKTLDATEEQYQELKDAAIESSKAQPVDAATILNIEALGAQLGFGVEQLQDFSRVVSGLDVSTNMNWEQAATNMAQFFNIMDEGKEHVGNYGSTIVDLGNHYATTESAISDMSMRIAGAGKALGMSSSDVLGLSAALSSMGITAEAGGSAISSIMLGIEKDVSTQSENLGRWAETAHMSADEFAQAWSESPVDALAAVLSGMNEAVEGGDSMAVMLDELGIGSIRQTDVLNRLSGNYGILTDAIGRANSAWAENTALDAEVANRNESISAKLQVAANKLQAIAIEIGGPLADALVSAIDAAEPLLQKVGDVATAFSKMDTESQRSIIKLGLMAAAAGPLLTVFGKLTSGFGSFLSVAGSGAQGIAAFAGQMKRGSSAVDALKVAFEGAETGLMGLKVALGAIAIAAAIALVAKLTEEWRRNNERARELDSALSGIRANTADLGSSLTTGARALGDFGDAASNTRGNIDEMLDSLSKHVERNAETRSSAEESIYMLGQYKSVIDECAGAGEVSADKMAMLEWALDGLEQATGEAYTAEQVLTGQFEDEAGEARDTAAAIDELIEKKQQEAKINALQDMYTDTLKEQEKARVELERAEEAYNENRSLWMSSAIEDYQKQGMSAEDAAARAAEAFDRTHSSEKQAVDTARAAYESLGDEAQTYANMMGTAIEAANEGWSESQSIVETYAGGVGDALRNMGVDVGDMCTKLDEAGISSQRLADVGGAAFLAFAQQAGGDMDELISLIQEYDGQPISDKYGAIHVEDGELVNAEGWRVAWNGAEWVYQETGVHVDVTGVPEAQSEIAGLNEETEKVQSKDSDVNANVNGTGDVENLNTQLERVPSSVTSNVNAYVSGAGSVASLRADLEAINGRSYSTTITTNEVTVKQTVNRARGAIINHASGDLLMANRRGTGVMLDSYNRIGEQGAELLMPLERPYSEKFAAAIADALNARSGTGGAVYNVYIDNAKVNDDEAIRADVINLLADLKRRAEMNRG